MKKEEILLPISELTCDLWAMVNLTDADLIEYRALSFDDKRRYIKILTTPTHDSN